MAGKKPPRKPVQPPPKMYDWAKLANENFHPAVLSPEEQAWADHEPRHAIVLTPELQASYLRKLAVLRRNWEARHDQATLAEAITLTTHFRQPIELWLEQAAVPALANTRSDDTKNQYKLNLKHFERWRFVRDLKGEYITDAAGRTRWIEKRKPSLDKAIELVANELKVSFETVKRSYKKVQKDMKAGRNAKYFIMKDYRYRDQG